MRFWIRSDLNHKRTITPRRRADLLAPRPEVGLQKQTANIEFGPVQIVAATTMDLWLPYAVEIEMESPDSLVFERHKYSGYRLYQVKSEILSPKIALPQ